VRVVAGFVAALGLVVGLGGSAGAAGVPGGVKCPPITSSVTNNDARFAAVDVWVFGDSIMTRCTWASLNAGLNANGKKGAFRTRSGASSDEMIDAALAVGRRTGKQPAVIVWELGANDSLRGRGVDDELNQLRAAYPRSRIIWVNTYRGNQLSESERTNSLTVAGAPWVEVVDWAEWAPRHRSILRPDLTHLQGDGFRQFSNLIIHKIIRR